MKEIELTGAIIKEETIIPLEKEITKGYGIVETLEPFPGYYGNIPAESKPTSLFLLTKELYARECIMRQAKKVKQKTGFSFDATTAKIQIGKTEYPAIRIKRMHQQLFIAAIAEAFEKEGIHFDKRQLSKGAAILKIMKYFVIRELEPNIYQDCNVEEMFYCPTPREIQWEEFKTITAQVKNNWDLSQPFDAAIGFMLRRTDVMEIIRIYAKNISTQSLNKIMGLYSRYT